jgi:hypothetical protein
MNLEGVLPRDDIGKQMDPFVTMALCVATLAGYAIFLYLIIERITRPTRRPFDWRQRR